MHRRCQARARLDATLLPAGPQDGPESDSCVLPSLDEIFAMDVTTQEKLGEGLVPLAEREYTACIANVLRYNRPDAWDHEVDGMDTAERAQARRAWTELFMFPKACLPALPGGKAKENRNRNILATKLERWAAGERGELWQELKPRARQTATQTVKSTAQDERDRAEVAVALARRGLPGKAVGRLVDPGLAPDTADIEMIMRSKFISPPATQATSWRPQAPVANEISEDVVVRAIRSFVSGAGPGPTAHRPDFMQQMIGPLGDKQSVPVITAFVNLLANGLAPPELAPYLGGATGTALDKTSKTGEQDARPACSGEFWRRLVSKCLLHTELANLREHLLPHQLAVGIPAGVEVMPHLARKWMAHHSEDLDRILLNYDEGNAHNEVDRHLFLQRMAEVAPGICKWLEYIYPTDRPTIVLYRGRVIDSAAGGQQGCPLMMACHAMVQRILLEGLGVVEVDPRTTPVAPVLDPPADLDMTPMFADDGFLAGKASEVLRSLQHLRPVMPRLGLRFSLLEAVPAARNLSRVDSTEFVRLGCTWNDSGNFEVLKSPVGSPSWCAAYSTKRAGQAICATSAVGALQHKHVGYYLLRASASASRLNCLARTTPGECCIEALGDFDVAQRSAFARLTGQPLSLSQRAQATAPVRHAGLGLRSASSVADAAYVASLKQIEELAVAIWPEYALVSNSAEERALGRLNEFVGTSAGTSPERADQRRAYKQKQWTRLLDDTRARIARERAGHDDAARLNAYSAKTTCRWTGVTPSKTLDTELANDAFVDHVAMQLGVDVAEEVVSCSFCGMVCDTRGRHQLSCTAGGDSTLVHNEVRDETYAWCQRARLRPKLEKTGLLHDMELPDGRRRPADVLVCQHVGFLHGLPGAPAPPDASRVALDFAVINALGQNHHEETLDAPLTAAQNYNQRKRRHLRTGEKCAAAGIAFEPVVIEAQGGVEPRAAAIFHRIAEGVAVAEGRDAGECKRTLLQRIALIIARANARSVRRRGSQSLAPTAANRGLKRALAETILEASECGAHAEMWF